MHALVRWPLVIAAMVPAAARAAEPATLPASGVGGMILNLALVLLLVLVCGWIYARGPARLRSAGGGLDIVASRQVGSRERLAVVQVGDEQVLVGITANGISHLHTLATPIDGEAAGALTNSFGERLREIGSAMKRRGATS